mgnify:FL=1
MVKIRLSRGGARKKPYYHIVVMDQRQRRDGRCLERIGSYDPNLETSDRISLDIDRLNYWVSQGAQMSDRVSLLKKYSQDEKNIENRTKIKTAQLEKLKAKRAQKKADSAKEEAPAAEQNAAPEAPAEEAPAAEQNAAPEAPAEEKSDK